MKHTLLLICLAIVSRYNAQDWAEEMSKPDANYYSVKAKFDAYWQTHDKTEKGKGYKAFMRWAYFAEKRVYPTGKLSLLGQTGPNYENWRASQQVQQGASNGKSLGGQNMLASATWTPMGPFGAISGMAGNQFLKSGRLCFITIHPAGSNTLYIGAPAGGLWSSTNGGSSWTTNTDNLSVLGCADLAIDPSSPSVMYLATGDGDAGDTRSIGVLKSTNSGSTWTTTGLSNTVNNNFLIRRLIINPSNTSILLAATNSGIYRTTNGGTSWTQVTTNNTYDLEFRPGNPNVVYASGSSFRMSTNGGATFTTISNGITTSGVNRMAIAVTPADTSYVYVLASNSSNSGFNGLYRSVTAGTTFSLMSNSPNLLGYSSTGNDTGGQGWYDLCVAASPSNKDEVVTGGVNVWRSTDGGSGWSIYGHWTGSGTAFTHADQHDLEYDANGVLFVCNDGTVYKRSGSTWAEISGSINISQIYRIGMSSLTANKWVTGHQDNGTSVWTGSSYNAELGGDGMDCFIDRTNDNNIFGSYQYGDFMRTGNAGSSWSSVVSGITGNGPWLAPWKQDPVSSNVLYCGYQTLFRSTNLGTSWGTLTAVPGSGNINEFAIAPSNSLVIYALRNSGIYKSVNAGNTWTTVTGSVPVSLGSPQYISIDPGDPNEAFVVLSGYSSGNKVFATSNGGSTWSNISGNLPNIPANCIVYQPNTNDRVYVGMDVGIYWRDSLSSNWTAYNTGLPNTPISELEISAATPTLLHAATYGRGVWVASVYMSAATPISNFTVPSAPVYCSTSAFTFSDQSGNNPTAWSWSVTPSTGVNINTQASKNPTISFSFGGNYTITMQAGNTNGLGSVVSRTINISAAPNLVTNPATQTVCSGSSVSFSVQGSSTYTWSDGGGNSSSAQFTPTGNTTYTVSGKTNGCTSSTTVSAMVYTTPTVVISGAMAVCEGKSALLLASGANSLLWNNGSTSPFISVTPSATTVYTATGTDASGCSGSATTTITVNGKPAMSVSANDSAICLNSPVILTASGAASYTWLPNGQTTGQLIDQPSATKTYTVDGIDANGCGNRASLTVTVDICESISELMKIRTWSIYPNPAKARAYVQIHDQSVSELQLEILDVTGRLVSEQKVTFNENSGGKSEINIATLAPGTYFVKAKGLKADDALLRLIKE